MMRLRIFFRRHILWVGFFAVLVPLMSILALQYWSLSKLEETSPVADKMWMKNYLMDVSKEVKFFYRTNAEQVLNTPASLLNEEGTHKSKYLFGKCDIEGAKRLFIARFSDGGNSQVVFYDPQSKMQVANPSAAESRAVNVSIAPLKLLSQEGSDLQSTGVSLDERDPENRIVFKPIKDESRKVIGISGMILDTEYFKQVYLPQAIRNSLPKFFPDQDNVIVTVYDESNRLVMATQPVKGQDNETWTTLPFFSDWRIGIRSRHMTPEQWAHWNFNFNLTLSIMMALAIMSGIVLALRTASREMKLSQMKADFVSNVSHELRTPLSSIRVFGEFLKLGRVRDEQKVCEYGEYIETESRRLTQLINNILDFSKIESGRKTYHFEAANVEEVVAGTLKTFDVQLRQHDLGISLDPSPKPLPVVIIDTDAIAQAFMNLLDNAVKYSATAKEIHIRLREKDGFITISVRDHGIGIPPEEQRKIFEKFYRVSTGLVHDVKGSGLGLSLVKHIVEAHKGKITVESEPGRGSTFTIHLPVAARLSDRTEKPKATPRTIGGEPPPIGLEYKH
jgi:signal transduction histidine kinase